MIYANRMHNRVLKHRTMAHSPSPDLTPMLDVVFIMLIFFIVTASFLQATGIVPNISKSRVGPPPRDTPIAFQIDAANDVYYAGRRIDHWSVGPIVKQEHTARPDVPVIIQTDENAHTRMVIRLYDEAVKAGMPRDRIAMTMK